MCYRRNNGPFAASQPPREILLRRWIQRERAPKPRLPPASAVFVRKKGDGGGREGRGGEIEMLVSLSLDSARDQQSMRS